jgi:hypothetical protein
MGHAIEPRLREALKSSLSDEARTRINNLLGQLEEARALHALVTMHYANAPVMQILNDFAGQAGADLGISDPSVAQFVEGRLGSVDLNGAGFWQSLRAVSDVSGIQPWVSQEGLSLLPQQGRPIVQINFNNYSHISGGFYIAPQVCQEMKTLNYATGGKTTGLMTLVVDVVPEPKLHILSAASMDWVRECVDEKGNSLLAPVGPRFTRMMLQRGPRQFFWSLSANLRAVQGTSKIARLRGELDIVVQTRRDTFAIDNITRARGMMKDDGHFNVTIVTCYKMGENYRVDVALAGVSPSMNEPALQDFMNSVELIDDHGNVIPRQAVVPQGGRTRQGMQNFMLLFQPTSQTPVKLQWERTVERKRLDLPFELHDLPLPD